MLSIKAGHGYIMGTIGGKDFDEELAVLKSLPKNRTSWNPIRKRWEISYELYWDVISRFKQYGIRYITPESEFNEMLSTVYIHPHREFKNTLSVTSIEHKVPSELITDEFRCINKKQMDAIIEWAKQNGYKYSIDPAVNELLNRKEEVLTEGYECSLFKLELYPFQKTGAKFLYNTQRAILADMTGLGKCPQSLAAVAKYVEEKKAYRCLIFCPNTIKRQWQNECNKFTTLNSVVIGGNKAERTLMYQKIKRDQSIQVVITNYDLLNREIGDLMSVKPDIIICDEVSMIKNRNAKRTKAIQSIPAKYKFALSATPLENSPTELFSVCNWLDPEILGTWWKFEEMYIVRDYWGGINRFKNLEMLRKKLIGVMIRRRKEEVADQLPKIITQVREIELDKTTRWVYNKICGDIDEAIENVGVMLRRKGEEEDIGEYENPLALFAILKQVCDDARLLETSKSPYAAELVKLFDMSKTKSNKANEILTVVQEIIENGEKVVIFSEFTHMLDLLRRIFNDNGIPNNRIVEISGNVNERKRQENRDKFDTDKSCSILLSSDAGKFGQNLQVSNNLISADVPWNPAILEQRLGRIHRLSSRHESVLIINFVTRDSVEEHIYTILNEKQDFFEQLIEGKSAEDRVLNPTVLRRLITKKNRG